MPGVRVPLEFVQDGQIILNIAPRAVGQLELGNEAISFHARFSGRPHSVIVPLHAVLAIYARENGAGTMFEPEEAYTNVTGEIEEEWLEDVDDSELSLDDLDSDTASTENSNPEPTDLKASQAYEWSNKCDQVKQKAANAAFVFATCDLSVTALRFSRCHIQRRGSLA